LDEPDVAEPVEVGAGFGDLEIVDVRADDRRFGKVTGYDGGRGAPAASEIKDTSAVQPNRIKIPEHGTVKNILKIIGLLIPGDLAREPKPDL
jgi:hypothetical protein